MAANKCFLYFLIFLSLSLSAQETEKISIAFKNQPLQEALIELDRETAIQLSYNPQALPSEMIVTKSFESESPERIVKEILGPSYQTKNISNYLIIQKAPVIRKEKATFQIKGGIRDAATGEELEDVSVYEINTLQSTLTSKKGTFDLKADSEFDEATFVISKRFYADTIIRVSNRHEILKPIVLKQEKQVSTGLVLRERVKSYSSGIAKFFTSLEIRKNAQNVNFTDVRWFQASLVPSIGTNRKMSSQIKNKISLNLISGYSYGVRGVELGGVYNIDREEVRGVQFGGFGNTVGGEVHGVQVGGFTNTTEDYLKGAQMAGFINVAADSVEGFQAAGFMNITRQMNGFQIGGFSNHVKKMSGYQLSGFINTTGEMDGLQIAGFINIAKEIKGVQFSVINIADTVTRGVPIGLVSVVKKGGFLSPAVESNDVLPMQFAFRIGMEKFYTLISAGADPGTYWALGGGFGSRRYTSSKKKFFINPELRWASLTKGKIKENEDSNLIKLNLNLGYKVFKELAITAGPSLNFYFTNHLDEFRDPIINLTKSPLIDDSRFNNRYQLWIGYAVGIGF